MGVGPMANFSLSGNSALSAECLVEGRVQPEVLSVCLSLLTTQGRGVQGPSLLHVPHPIKVCLPQWRLGGKREPLPLKCTCPGLSLSIRQLVAGWKTPMPCSPREKSPLNGTWWGEGALCSWLQESWVESPCPWASMGEGESSLWSNTTLFLVNFKRCFWIDASSFVVCP